MSKELNDKLRAQYDNWVYELDTYRSILVRIKGFDYRHSDIDMKISENEKLNTTQLRQFDGLISRKCKKCSTLKAPQSHHCGTCGRCIAKMDHHCPWVNNCVGIMNQKHFLLFLIYVFLGSTHALFLVGYKAAGCLDANCAMFAEFSTVVIAGIAIFLALLFGLFVLVMFCDQISCIIDNTSTIDKLQKKRAMKQGKNVE